ncbi:MAG: response regulator [Verrucomicrobiota bacterium]
MVKKLLIIDDDAVVAQSYSVKLQSEGFETQIAFDGIEALDLLPKFLPDLIILDLMLPGMSGLEVLGAIRESARFSALPVIMLSNHYLEAGSSADIEAGLNRSLIKADTNLSTLVSVINEMFSANAGSKPNPLQLARNVFCERVLESIVPMQSALQALARAQVAAPEALDVIRSKSEALIAGAAELALTRISHLLSALAGLAQQLSETPVKSTLSTTRTLAGALDALNRLSTAGLSAERLDAPLALVVEDELVSQEVVRAALERSRIRSVVVANGELALSLLEFNRFDIVFLDVTLPGINGYQVCTALRQLKAHQTTPVVFITGLKEFEARTQSALSGANDLIAKPVSIPELAVKALTHVVKAN